MFDSDDSDDNEEEDMDVDDAFRIRPEYEGKKGQKVSLLNRYQHHRYNWYWFRY